MAVTNILRLGVSLGVRTGVEYFRRKGIRERKRLHGFSTVIGSGQWKRVLSLVKAGACFGATPGSVIVWMQLLSMIHELNLPVGLLKVSMVLLRLVWFGYDTSD